MKWISEKQSKPVSALWKGAAEGEKLKSVGNREKRSRQKRRKEKAGDLYKNANFNRYLTELKHNFVKNDNMQITFRNVIMVPQNGCGISRKEL